MLTQNAKSAAVIGPDGKTLTLQEGSKLIAEQGLLLPLLLPHLGGLKKRT